MQVCAGALLFSGGGIPLQQKKSPTATQRPGMDVRETCRRGQNQLPRQTRARKLCQGSGAVTSVHIILL